MSKFFLVGVISVFLSQAFAFEPGLYEMVDIENNIVQLNSIPVKDPYLKTSLKTHFKKFSPHEVVEIFQVYPGIMGFIHHLVFFKSKLNHFGFCLFDIYAEDATEVTQCTSKMETSSDPKVWKLYFQENGIEIYGGTLTYKGKI